METQFKVGDKVSCSLYKKVGTVISTEGKDHKDRDRGLPIVVQYEDEIVAYNFDGKGGERDSWYITLVIPKDLEAEITISNYQPKDPSILLEESVARLKAKMQTQKFADFVERYKAENGL